MTKIRVIIGIVIVCTAFAFGRFSAPERIKIQEKIVEVEKKTTEKESEAERNKHKETTTTEKTNPDGSKETTTKVVEDSTTGKKSSENSTDEKSKDSQRTEERTRTKVNVSALAGLPFTNLASPVFGAAVTSDVVGPISTGIWALTNGVAGLSIGLTF